MPARFQLIEAVPRTGSGKTQRRRLFEQTLAGRERVLGADHPDTVITRTNLALACEDVRGDAER